MVFLWFGAASSKCGLIRAYVALYFVMLGAGHKLRYPIRLYGGRGEAERLQRGEREDDKNDR